MVQNGISLDLTWNTQGQLVSVNTNGLFAESYTWGPLGNRASTTDSSGTTYHIYDGDHCVADVDSSGNIIASYTWGTGIDNLLAVTVHGDTTTNTYYAIKDHLNSIHALVDESGSTAMTVNYNAWGTPQNSSFSIQNSSFKLRYLFQGREYSHATELYNFRARWYSSDIGRWLSKDPIGLEGGLNLYVFCGNNPVNYRDPLGLWTITLGGGGNIQAVAALGGDVGYSIGYSPTSGFSHGPIGSVNVGVGTPAGFAGGFIQWTDAESVDDLQGFSLQTGLGIDVGVAVGADLVMGFDASSLDLLLSGPTYQGGQVNLGIGFSPLVAEIHTYLAGSVGYSFNNDCRK